MKALTLLFETRPGSRSVSTADKIAATVAGKLPYPMRQLAKDMAGRYGNTVGHWTASISHAFSPVRHRSDGAIGHLHKAYVGNTYCIVLGGGISELGRTGPTPGQRISQEEEQEHERISWQKMHPTISVAYSELTEPEQLLKEPLQSNWRLAEEAAWLWVNSGKRGEDVYGRKGGRVFGGHGNQLSGNVSPATMPKEV